VERAQDEGGPRSYYAAAHTEQEAITQQPRMLTAGKLREYQLVGLQWMISLYNNRLNGILADEMGLGKTVQVMALVAYLMESKNNYGPHLIIVPNAVVVNWKSEIRTWLPKITPVYYLGTKEQRARIFLSEVCNMKFNVLVTTYEYIMRDRAKLSKVDWKYIIIDEAQRMKDRESRLSRDLDRFKCERRLLLTGTPLQNDLQELWALLNLLLPQVFDNKGVFQVLFNNRGAEHKKEELEGEGGDTSEDWLELEKRVIVISRLHQILEPFMLRRMVEDVEKKLPPKVLMTMKIGFSAFQSSHYEWVRQTGTVRVDPNNPLKGKRANLAYVPLQNKCMELRKVCNHPLLSYPQLVLQGGIVDELVRCCGKFWVLDQILVKLFHTEHRVLLFSTMTRLLDLVEQYLQWRNIDGERNGGKKMGYCRIDGCTPLEVREEAINAYNAPGSDKFVFLLSIRAAGRGLNLQVCECSLNVLRMLPECSPNVP
jgi:SWI/SNF-related matrix-associated actin-dependent regulator of chromatin subfamily A protein 2/4